MIYTLGCSFTRWHWPTWADWLGAYVGSPITNLADPGYTNELIYQQLLTRHDQIGPEDTVYIMWTGSNRNCVWYDSEYVQQQDCHEFFPDTNGRLWYGNNYRGLYKTHPAHLPSFTHLVMDMFKIILNTQLLLDRFGCNYKMMFWRNPWSDVRERFSPAYAYTWTIKKFLSAQEIKTAEEIIKTAVMAALLQNINWCRFVSAPDDIFNSERYSGLWEYVLARKDLLILNHDADDHPNTLAHHDWLLDYIMPDSAATMRSRAADLARDWRTRSWPDHDRRQEILGLLV